MFHTGKPRGAVAALSLTATALLALGCGSSGGAGAKPAAGTGRDTVTNGVKVHHPFAGTGSKAVNDDNPAGGGSGSAARQRDSARSASTVTLGYRTPAQREPAARNAGHSSNPCKLVTRGEAEAILGHPVSAPTLAPLGPSCIYRAHGARQAVTLAVQATPFAPLKSRLRKARQETVAGHAAFCGVYGQTTTIVALSRGRVLTIAAPCATGFRFAAKALPRV
jgi:hypothetical protein